jgi:hypothetical protein
MVPFTTAKKERSINIYYAGHGIHLHQRLRRRKKIKKEKREKEKCGRKNATHKNKKNAPSPQRAAKENNN